ncbi:MAG: aspartate--tRNA(Asn) ligase [Eubacteriales bacterium]|nr:aspartate--tRNA(Asn) ligase [Eubacteriales bacterium]
MERTYIGDVQGTGERMKIQGFVENLRNKRTMAFLVIRDITGKLQVTVEKSKNEALIPVIDSLSIGSFVTAEGPVVSNEYVKMGGKEMLPDTMQIESIAEAFPIKEDSSIDLRIDYRWLDLRSERNTLIFQVQTTLVAAMRQFMLDHHFMEIHTPKLIGAASESGADVFELGYFDRKAYLSQSPQFYKQMAMASGFDRIFEVGPVFRAEKSFTNKHATEFTGFDMEMSCIESFRDVMAFEAELLQYCLAQVKERWGEKIKEVFGLEVIVPTLPFPEMKLEDVYRELEERYGFTVPEEEKNDLTTEAERLCAQLSMEKFGHEFLFITDYKPEKRAFYHMRDENGMPLGYDLIWRGVEITTGAQREHRYEQLKAQADEKGLGEDVKFYLEFFRYGCPPHGGFGLGIDRMTMLILGITIKEVMFLFRGPNRLTP